MKNMNMVSYEDNRVMDVDRQRDRSLEKHNEREREREREREKMYPTMWSTLWLLQKDRDTMFPVRVHLVIWRRLCRVRVAEDFTRAFWLPQKRKKEIKKNVIGQQRSEQTTIHLRRDGAWLTFFWYRHLYGIAFKYHDFYQTYG